MTKRTVLQRGMRVLQAADRLLEILIFDTLLATPRRRRAVAIHLGCTALTFYALSGWLFIPHPTFQADPISGAPYIDDASWPRTDPDVAALAVDSKLTPERIMILHRELGRHAVQLAHAMALLDLPEPPSFRCVPDFRVAREAASLLTAHGVELARVGRYDEAVHEWLHAIRLGRVMSRGAAHPPTLIEGLVAVATQRRALLALVDLAEKHHLSPLGAVLVRRELALRDREGAPTLNALLRGDAAGVNRELDRSIANGQLDGLGSAADILRLVLPVRLADRAKLIAEARDLLNIRFAQVIAGVEGNTIVHPVATDDDVNPLRLLPAVFSRARARALIADLLIAYAVPDPKAAAERLALIDATVAKLDAATHALIDPRRTR